jgi:hypothetical protein
MHTGSNEIGLDEEVRFKGNVEFSFNFEKPDFSEIQVSSVKKKLIIKSEIRDTRKHKHKSSNLF